MSTLTPDDRQALHQRLLDRETELQAEVRAVIDEEADTPSAIARQVDDSGEQGEQRIRSAVRYAERERDIEELRDIEAAKERMADGSYGECEDCGELIAPARLQAQPAARRCLRCQEVHERNQPPLPRYTVGL